jgi:hypothetical protein
MYLFTYLLTYLDLDTGHTNTLESVAFFMEKEGSLP